MSAAKLLVLADADVGLFVSVSSNRSRKSLLLLCTFFSPLDIVGARNEFVSLNPRRDDSCSNGEESVAVMRDTKFLATSTMIIVCINKMTQHIVVRPFRGDTMAQLNFYIMYHAALNR